MKLLTKLFVCEFITGGGFNHIALNSNLTHGSALVQEGAIMRDALLRDLSSLPYEIKTTVDARLEKPKACHATIIIYEEDDVWAVWEQIIESVDAVWFVAPETGGILEKLTRIAVNYNKLILGSDVATIKIAASKTLTYKAFKNIDIVTLPTSQLNEWQPSEESGWVVKPDDGVGCEEVLFFANTQQTKHWLQKNKALDHYVIQPFQHGVPASISCIFNHGKAQLLSCNKQLVTQDDNVFKFNGVIVNGMAAYWDALAVIANKAAEQLPGLKGYVGIDVIISQDLKNNHDEIILLEINPRLTTSFVGLAKATGVNPAELVINVLTKANVVWPDLQRNIVQVDVSTS